MEIRPESIERQGHLVGTTLRVEVDVRIGVVGPTGRHLLSTGRDAVVALHLIRSNGRAVLDGERAEVEVVEGGERLEEELRRADKVLGGGWDSDQGLGEVGVVEPLPTRARIGRCLTRRYGVSPSHHGTAHDIVRGWNARLPQRFRLSRGVAWAGGHEHERNGHRDLFLHVPPSLERDDSRPDWVVTTSTSLRRPGGPACARMPAPVSGLPLPMPPIRFPWVASTLAPLCMLA